HAFHGHICLLAGLASASTVAVTTIVAAPTEAEQADAAPASGARSAHDAAVTHSELVPLTAMAYTRSGAIFTATLTKCSLHTAPSKSLCLAALE
ncbi:hypothetical protein V8C86DRAFT_2775858, partial [Haematococcus lacustris]